MRIKKDDFLSKEFRSVQRGRMKIIKAGRMDLRKPKLHPRLEQIAGEGGVEAEMQGTGI